MSEKMIKETKEIERRFYWNAGTLRCSVVIEYEGNEFPTTEEHSVLFRSLVGKHADYKVELITTSPLYKELILALLNGEYGGEEQKLVFTWAERQALCIIRDKQFPISILWTDRNHSINMMVPYGYRLVELLNDFYAVEKSKNEQSEQSEQSEEHE